MAHSRRPDSESKEQRDSNSFFTLSLKELAMNKLLADEHNKGLQKIINDFEKTTIIIDYLQLREKKFSNMLAKLFNYITTNYSDPIAIQKEVKALMSEYPCFLCETSNGVKEILKKTSDALCIKNNTVEEKKDEIADQKDLFSSLTPFQIMLALGDVQLANIMKEIIIKEFGPEEALKQLEKQYPEKWKETEEKKWQDAFTRLEELTAAISNAKGDDIKANIASTNVIVNSHLITKKFAEFKDSINAILQVPITTGQYFNLNILLAAEKAYAENKLGDCGKDPRALVFWQRVIGYIQSLMPVNDVQAYLEQKGLELSVQNLRNGNPQNRSLNVEVFRAPASPVTQDVYKDSGLGVNFALTMKGKGWGAAKADGRVKIINEHLSVKEKWLQSMAAELSKSAVNKKFR